MPDVVLAVAGDVAGLLVVRNRVERFAVVGPLHLAVVALDDREPADWLGIAGPEHRRPVLGAFAAAVGLAHGVLVIGIERHALVIGKHLSPVRLDHLQRAVVLGAG